MTDISDETVVITSVDCTPGEPAREAYLSDAQHAFAVAQQKERNAKGARELAALQALGNKLNRGLALRQGTNAKGERVFHTQCACGWHGLRVLDAEVARREYDVHACSFLDANGRWEPGQTLHRTTEAPLAVTAWAAETKQAIAAAPAIDKLAEAVVPVEFVAESTPTVETTGLDGWISRVKLLEVP